MQKILRTENSEGVVAGLAARMARNASTATSRRQRSSSRCSDCSRSRPHWISPARHHAPLRLRGGGATFPHTSNFFPNHLPPLLPSGGKECIIALGLRVHSRLLIKDPGGPTGWPFC